MKKINPNWLYLKLLINGAYPKSITDLAEKLNISPEQIAKDKGVDGTMIVDFAIRRDLVMAITSIMQTPDSPTEVLIEFMDKSTLICIDSVGNLTRKIDAFLQQEPTTQMTPYTPQQFAFVIDENLEEKDS